MGSRESGASLEHPSSPKQESILPTDDVEPANLDASKTAEPPREASEIVDWDGPGDPQNPQNWSRSKKARAIAIVSLVTFITPLASTIFAPSIDQVMARFGSDSPQLASFVVSVYLIGYAFGPLVIAPLSEMYGRLPFYNICNVLFVIFSVACALSPNLVALIIFRLLSGVAGSCPQTIGAGSLADMIGPEKRGVAMSWWVSGPLLGPVVGPIIGGYLSQAKGWRWSFWFVAILGAAVAIATFLLLRESYAYAILDRKTKRLRRETGNLHLRSALDTGRSPGSLFKLAIVRPTKMLLFSPIVFLMSLYMSILYGYLYLIFTILPSIYITQYGFSTGTVGLAYIGFGVGSILGLLVNANVSDRLALRLKEKRNTDHRPEYRLPPMIFFGFFLPAGLFWFGWTAEYNCHWILPILGIAIFAFGTVGVFMTIVVYLVDAFTVYAASATAASTVLRSLVGALLPLGGRELFTNLGMGWGSSLLGFIATAMLPLPFLLWRYGEAIRRIQLFNVEF